jgi:hypothetical protein
VGPNAYSAGRAGGGEQGAVVRLEVRRLHLALEDVELVTKHHDLHVLCVLGAEGKDGEQLNKS